MIKEFKSNSGSVYKIDTEKVTCTCPNFKYRCCHYPDGNPGRLCKHLTAELESNPDLFPAIYKSNGSLDDNKVVMDDKVRYPRVLFDSYIKSIKLLCKTSGIIDKCEVCGSYRRLNDLVSDIDLLVTLKDPSNKSSLGQLLSKLQLLYPNHEVLAAGELKVMMMIDKLVHLDIKVVPDESWGSALMHFTGPKTENLRLRAKAIKLNKKLNEYGLFNEEGINLSVGMTESQIYSLLGESYKDPWNRN